MHPADDDNCVLRLEDVTKVYSGIVAVRHANLSLRRGAVNVLVGENGAGKSTLMPDHRRRREASLGRILLDGQAVEFHSPADASATASAWSFRNSNLFGNLSVAENIFATRELNRAFAASIIARRSRGPPGSSTGSMPGIDAETLVEDLPIGQQQLVEIARRSRSIPASFSRRTDVGPFAAEVDVFSRSSAS